MRVLEILAVGCIRAYQWVVRPVLPMACRFWPSCSDYALEAVHRHGVARGGLLAIGRLLRCHPWGGSGFDPVPSRVRLWSRNRCLGTHDRELPCHDHSHDPI